MGSSGPTASGDKFDYLWPEMKRLKVDLVDEHYYAPEEFFLSQATRYDSYDRKGPKVFAGEYACHAKGKKYNHFNASLMEAAFMTGLERNADIVHMATYAPLFAHVEGWQWRPDMIWFDNLNSVATTSYYVQQIYSVHKGSRTLPITMGGRIVTGAEGQHGLYASSVVDDETNEYIVKIVNTSESARNISLRFKGLKRGRLLSEGRCITLASSDMDSDNSLENPDIIIPVESILDVSSETLSVTVPAQSFSVYIVK